MLLLQCSDGIERLYYCMEYAIKASHAIQTLEGESILRRSYTTHPPDTSVLPS